LGGSGLTLSEKDSPVQVDGAVFFGQASDFLGKRSFQGAFGQSLDDGFA
jgi:hypothetical protein